MSLTEEMNPIIEQQELGLWLFIGKLCLNLCDPMDCSTPGSSVIYYFLQFAPMTNLYSILKGRDIALPTKFHILKPMVFPVVMYGCESQIVKKPEH